MNTRVLAGVVEGAGDGDADGGARQMERADAGLGDLPGGLGVAARRRRGASPR
jgi:hypothetical protein